MADTIFNTFTFVERIETLEATQSDLNGAANKTQAQIATVKQEVAVTQSNTQNVQSRVQILEGMQGELKSNAMAIESRVDSTRGEMSRLQQTLGKYMFGYS
ncbi:hypothetical protein DPMN_136273 [Dreissena polymorpha]|uniref:Uncharacterized protein n=1 Tax=Dreissena polymorpha TaxID=45954 RepID=A0A9D4FZI5_DREPO|nr:hypothetical protein DPMN_136273 [Dreissena polymorpha]